MARQLPTPEVAAARWVTGMTNARQRYVEGTNAVQEANNPMVRAIASVQRWQANVSSPEARNRWVAGLQAVTLAAWKDACRNKGAAALAIGAQQAEPQMRMFYSRLFPAISAARQAIDGMPNGTFEERMARFDRYARSIRNSFVLVGPPRP